jgi:TolA-binding protein
MAKHKDTCKFNLLSKKEADARKTFKVAWHGIFLLLLIFTAVLIGTTLNLQLRHKITTLSAQLAYDTQLLNSVRLFNNSVVALNNQISTINETHARSARIDSEKNSWAEILYRLSDFSNRNPLIWIEHVSMQNDRFSVRGRSYHRDRITTLAQLFQDGNITRINEGDIVGNTVWDFDINFKRPVGELPVDIPVPYHLISFDNYREYIDEKQRMAIDTPTPTPVATEPIAIDDDSSENMPAVTEERSDVTPETITDEEVTTGFAFINDPVDSATLFNLAQDSYLSNSFNDAIVLLDRYIHLFPEGAELAQVKYLLGEIHFIQNSFSRAIEFFNAVYNLRHDKVAEALFFMARSYELLNDIPNAIRFYTILADEFASSPLARTAQEHINIIRGGNNNR